MKDASDNLDAKDQRLVFLSGSISLTESRYDAEDDEYYESRRFLSPAEEERIKRFKQICDLIGETLGRNGFGIAGCAAHHSRVLASQEARTGLLRANPQAVFTTEGMKFPLDDQERSKFVKRVFAGIFVAGSSGTQSEFDLCRQKGIRPLIPVAGAGGTAAALASVVLNSSSDFLTRPVARHLLEELARPDAPPNTYASAIAQVLRAHAELPPNTPGQKRWWKVWR
jgi:hypothetical protein